MQPRTNVMTPNGYGFFENTTTVAGDTYGVVRHIIKDMTNTENGICWTPRAELMGLWLYKMEDIKEYDGEPKKKSKSRY